MPSTSCKYTNELPVGMKTLGGHIYLEGLKLRKQGYDFGRWVGHVYYKYEIVACFDKGHIMTMIDDCLNNILLPLAIQYDKTRWAWQDNEIISVDIPSQKVSNSFWYLNGERISYTEILKERKRYHFNQIDKYIRKFENV